MKARRLALGLGAAVVVLPAWAAGSEGGRIGPTLFAVTLLVMSAKIGGLLVERWGQPAVLGELLVGMGLGNLVPLVIGRHGAELFRADPTLHFLAEVGVLLLLFEVGLESDLRALIRVGPSALLVAVFGVVAPVALGWGATAWLLPESPLLVHLFIGATLAATSVGITARVLRDLGAVQERGRPDDPGRRGDRRPPSGRRQVDRDVLPAGCDGSDPQRERSPSAATIREGRPRP